MPDLHDVYATMNSLDFKMQLAAERTQRIGCIVAHEQHGAAGMEPEPRTRAGRRRYMERTRYWREEMQARGWPEGWPL